MAVDHVSFARGVTAKTTLNQRRWTPTSRAASQTFRWVHFPPDVMPGEFVYTATAMFSATADPRAEVDHLTTSIRTRLLALYRTGDVSGAPQFSPPAPVAKGMLS